MPGIKVGIGGFHVSGTMAMLKDRDPWVQKALDMGVSLFAGEAEGRLGQVLLDAFNGRLEPVYNFMDDLPNIEGVASPLLPAERVDLTAGATTALTPDGSVGSRVRFARLLMYKAAILVVGRPTISNESSGPTSLKDCIHFL